MWDALEDDPIFREWEEKQREKMGEVEQISLGDKPSYRPYVDDDDDEPIRKPPPPKQQQPPPRGEKGLVTLPPPTAKPPRIFHPEPDYPIVLDTHQDRG